MQSLNCLFALNHIMLLGYDSGAKKGKFVINEGQTRIVRQIYIGYTYRTIVARI